MKTVRRRVTGTSTRDLIDASTFPGYAEDVDGDALGLAIIDADTTNGAARFSLDNGDTSLNLGTPSDSTAVLLSADDGARVRFVPNAGYSGTDHVARLGLYERPPGVR